MTNAEFIATIAHKAKGQTRADGTTPYIVHPRRVHELVLNWHVSWKTPNVTGHMLDAAWLHDVIEDTRLTYDDLREYGVSEGAIDLVEGLTKKDVNVPATKEYYDHIAESYPALVVKCADRCANLEDALSEVVRTGKSKRWAKYVEKTMVDVLPMYADHLFLESQLRDRLVAIRAELKPELLGCP